MAAQAYPDLREEACVHLLEEVNSQLIATAPTTNEVKSSATGEVLWTLKSHSESHRRLLLKVEQIIRGEKYLLFRYTLATIKGIQIDQTAEYLLNLPSSGQLGELDRPTGLHLWQIAAFCQPSWFLDPDAVRKISQARLFMLHKRDGKIPEQVVSWDNPAITNWASKEKSSLLVLQGSLLTKNVLEGAALELIDYLVENGQQVVWILGPGVYQGVNVTELPKWGGPGILKQIVVQILRQNKSFNSLARLAKMVRLLENASSTEEWFNIIAAALESGSRIYMIINLADLGFKHDDAGSWPTHFLSLFDQLKQNSETILKVVILTPRPLSDSISSKPIPLIRISPSHASSSKFPLWQRICSATEKAPINLPILKRPTQALIAGDGVEPESKEMLFLEDIAPKSKIPESLNSVNSVEPKRKDNPTDASQLHHLCTCKEPPHPNGPSHSPVSEEVPQDYDKGTHPEPRSAPMGAKPVGRGSRDWFREMQSFEKCVDASRKPWHQKVKVAILDTGVDVTHPDIAKIMEDGRIIYYDFINCSSNAKDEDGHGTHCTSVLAKLAPNTEIYVGRVFRSSRAIEDSIDVVNEAIRHAVGTWKVDIISLSLGFTKDNDDIRKEIWLANANSTLVFAAAANNTHNEDMPIRFPARMREVICIFSSDAHGAPSEFNPQPKYDRPNFMFPGENIEGAWPAAKAVKGTTFERNGATYKNVDGTSCATPIAAAVAAGVLEFAWQKREYEIRNVKLLQHLSGMSALFLKRMVDDYKIGDNSSHYVKPWKLISTSRRKEEIPIHISDVMDNVS